ncbi:hypothetical protein QTH89_20310 [Variovorax sp. J22G21]|uniref:hypothetical protein n=1 Tax=Variovorax fucosicus TaxID=3053517 RepID=UPI002575038A|nr:MULTISPECIES: hypothetical protein [unclassified Variovorax]MDM0038787.1 hypothetical protein [Variovorax sp. J22R193]MDM0063563.1 hypothetical protein [Variovorax sp. J22G21]
MLEVPLLWPSIATPPGEVVAIKDLYAALTGLNYSVEAWEAALLLYETSKQPPSSISRSVASRWRFIACNECVLELYHLRARLEKIRSVMLRACPSLRPLLNTSTMRSASKRLDEYFPDIELLRHATAHRGENEAHPESHAPDGHHALSGFREPDRYSTPYNGTLRYLDVTNQSLERIYEVVAEFLSAFADAATELEKQGSLE